MATGDVTISVAVAGGVTKTVTLDSATRVLSRANVAGNDETIDTDAEWQVFVVNKLANVILAQANSQAQAAASWTPKTYTAAT
jgi:hypothetical protein|tara:strand:+ start:965 stop:1213 length:249 start_codon:yes stop_codon:yes gene_type:complete